MNTGSINWPIGWRRVTGKCHRCGWTDDLSKVSRHQRMLLGTDRHVRMLCDDCRSDIVGSLDVSSPTGVATAKPARSDVLRPVA